MSETTLHTSDGNETAIQPIQGQRYKFTLEELRTLKECNRESFWTRSVPLCSVFTLGVYAGIKKGILQPSPRFGALPKVSVAVTVGYFLGKLMYQPKCIEKIMQLPNSPLADMLRKQTGRGIVASETMALEPGFYSAAPSSSSPTEQAVPSHEQTGHMDVMDTRPMHNFDSFTGTDYGKADTTDQMLDDSNLPPKPPQYQQTYDDLRRQNRIEYETKMHSPSIVSRPPPPNPNEPLQRPGYTTRDTTSGAAKKKNMYGDVWDDVQNPRS